MQRIGIGSPFLKTFTGPSAAANAHDYPQHAKNLGNVKNAPWSFSAFLDVYSRGTGDFIAGKKTASQTVDFWDKQLGKKKPAPGMVEAAKASGQMQR
jgi:hypothetical protein